MFQSSKEHEVIARLENPLVNVCLNLIPYYQVHTSTCRETLRLPEDQSKKDAEKLRSHLASRLKILRKKENEILLDGLHRSQLQPRGSRSVTAGFPPESQQSRLKEALEKETKVRNNIKPILLI